MVHVLELVRPAGQDVGKANLDLGADAFDTGGDEEGSADSLLAATAATGGREEYVRLERGNVFLDIARERLGKAVERPRGHVGYRLDAVAKAYVQVYCRSRKGGCRQDGYKTGCLSHKHLHINHQ